MEFTEEQQTHIDKLINKRVGAIKTKAETDASAAILAVEQKHNEEINTLKGQLDELEVSQGESSARIKSALLTAAASRLNAYNEKQVVKLIEDQVIITGVGELAVIDSEGNTRFDGEGKPMKVETFLAEYLDANPNLVKASGTSGSGSRGSTSMDTGAAKMSRSSFNNMNPERQNDYMKQGGKLSD